MLTIACCLVVELGLGIDRIRGQVNGYAHVYLVSSSIYDKNGETDKWKKRD